MMDDYSDTEGYVEDADLGLGCGLPTQFAQIKEGDTVVDLGSGAGNDCFIARHETGPSGKVIGIDFTPAMIDRARINADKLKYNNVEFRQGDIEDMPVSDREDLLRQLTPGSDGLVLRDGSCHATFLPKVWEQLPEPESFLTQLLKKAGLPEDHWSDTLQFERYRSTSFAESKASVPRQGQ